VDRVLPSHSFYDQPSSGLKCFVKLLVAGIPFADVAAFTGEVRNKVSAKGFISMKRQL
jgi:hypothetical protein